MFNKIWSAVATFLILAACYVSQAPLLVTAASLLGIVYVLGVAQSWKHANAFGAAFALIWAYHCYNAGYLADVASNILISLPFCLYGWYNWCKHGKEKEVETQKLTKEKGLFLVSLGFAVTIASFGLTMFFKGNLPYFDALSNGILIIATILSVGAYKEQWYAWIPYNILGVYMWFTAVSFAPEVLALLVMRIVFLVNSLIGYYNWAQVMDSFFLFVGTFLLVSLPYTPWRFHLRPHQAVTQWGGTQARGHKISANKMEKSY